MAQLPLLHSPADVVRRALIGLGLGRLPVSGTGVPWPIYVSKEPGAPDNCITLFDTAGTHDGRFMFDGTNWDHYGVQVRVRAASFPVGWQKIEAIRQAFAQTILNNTIAIEDATYVLGNMAHIGVIIPLGDEQVDAHVVSSRQIFTLNATCNLHRTTTGTGS